MFKDIIPSIAALIIIIGGVGLAIYSTYMSIHTETPGYMIGGILGGLAFVVVGVGMATGADLCGDECDDDDEDDLFE